MTFAAVRANSLGDQAYSALVDALIKGALRAGDRVRIQELALRLGTSVTPVRDAVLRLVQDEALEMRNSRDIRVPKLSAEQYVEIRTIRLELECLAAEQAAIAASSDDIRRLEALLHDHQEATKRDAHANDAARNQAFHEEVTAIAGAPILLGILRRLWTRTGPFVSEGYERSERVIKDQHLLIVKAIRNHNPELARAAVRKDILEGSNVILEVYRRGAAFKHSPKRTTRVSTRAPGASRKK